MMQSFLYEIFYDLLLKRRKNLSANVFPFKQNKNTEVAQTLCCCFFILRITKKTSWCSLGGSRKVSFLFLFSSIEACLGVFSAFQIEFLLHGVHMLSLWEFHYFHYFKYTLLFEGMLERNVKMRVHISQSQKISCLQIIHVIWFQKVQFVEGIFISSNYIDTHVDIS